MTYFKATKIKWVSSGDWAETEYCQTLLSLEDAERVTGMDRRDITDATKDGGHAVNHGWLVETYY